MNFDFISDDKLKQILIRDYNELTSCTDCKAYKSVLILTGSIVEAILVDYLSVYMEGKKSTQDLLKLDLFSLIKLGIDNELISEQTEGLSTVVRYYRNLIHPGKEKRTGQKFDKNTAAVAVNLLNIIVEDIEESYKKTYIYSATDIINKLSQDSVSQDIFKSLLEKVHDHEKVNLYNELIQLHISGPTQYQDLPEPKKYIMVLREYIKREAIENQLNKLIYLIETSDQLDVMECYYLLYEDIEILKVKEVNKILQYVIYVIKTNILDTDKIKHWCVEMIFSSLTICLKYDLLKEDYCELISDIVYHGAHGNDEYLFAYNEMEKSWTTEEESLISDYLNKHADSAFATYFFSHYDKKYSTT